jgi:ubiquinone/menaquinone biosynthesis C-methylase UbiE
MVITSRSAAEYQAMFDLPDLTGTSVLDCCAGASSFAAETPARVVAVDPAYGQAGLAADVAAGLRSVENIIAGNEEHFDWTWYGTREHRQELRTAAARLFLDDIQANPRRYVAGALPHLPFRDASFDLVLCSHLLFTWSDVFDVQWHRKALAEMLRVARREVRVFPLVVQATGEPVEFLEDLRNQFGAATRTVPYSFQVGANQMLVLGSSGDI